MKHDALTLDRTSLYFKSIAFTPGYSWLAIESVTVIRVNNCSIIFIPDAIDQTLMRVHARTIALFVVVSSFKGAM